MVCSLSPERFLVARSYIDCLDIQNLTGYEPCQHPRSLCTVGTRRTRGWSQLRLDYFLHSANVGGSVQLLPALGSSLPLCQEAGAQLSVQWDMWDITGRLQFLRPWARSGQNSLIWICYELPCERNINTICCNDTNIAAIFITVWQDMMYLTKYHLGTQSYLSKISPRRIWRPTPTETCEVKIFQTRDTMN